MTVAVEPGEQGSRTLTHRVEVPAPIEQVWHAVATEEGWQEWAVPLARSIPGTDRFETSYDPLAIPGAPNTIEQQWLGREASSRVAFRTTRTPEGFPDAQNYLQVTSVFLLEPVGQNATHVTYIGFGFAPGEAGDRLLSFFTEGNRSSLEQLRERFVSGPRNWSVED